jgi:uncharacterized protein (TIGR02285 family)
LWAALLFLTTTHSASAVVFNDPQAEKANNKDIIWGIAHYPPRFVIEAPGKFGGQAGLQHEILEASLPQYNHLYQQLTYAEFTDRLLNKQNVCTSMILKTPPREQVAVFSIPWHIDLPIAIAMTYEAWERIDKPESLNFSDLLADIRLKGGIEKQRSYGILDERINRLEFNKNLERYELIASQILPLLQTGGIDYTIEYPYLAEYYLRSISATKDIVSVPIEDGFEYVFGYIACTKNPWGEKLISELNEAIKTERVKKGYLNLLQLPYRQLKDKQKVEEIFYKYFIDSM